MQAFVPSEQKSHFLSHDSQLFGGTQVSPSLHSIRHLLSKLSLYPTGQDVQLSAVFEHALQVELQEEHPLPVKNIPDGQVLLQEPFIGWVPFKQLVHPMLLQVEHVDGHKSQVKLVLLLIMLLGQVDRH